ncbi:hypothetical protein KSS87_020239 [Heliosperma pusillum]|nr:hypothetical protein KSS87_020239 [Heliosperma pusillum]
MGKPLKPIIFAILIVMTVTGLAFRAEAQRCSSTYDCRVTQCPCINGHCHCDPHRNLTPGSADEESVPSQETKRIRSP